MNVSSEISDLALSFQISRHKYIQTNTTFESSLWLTARKLFSLKPIIKYSKFIYYFKIMVQMYCIQQYVRYRTNMWNCVKKSLENLSCTCTQNCAHQTTFGLVSVLSVKKWFLDLDGLESKSVCGHLFCHHISKLVCLNILNNHISVNLNILNNHTSVNLNILNNHTSVNLNVFNNHIQSSSWLLQSYTIPLDF